ncbi:MAG: MoaD/ThiS family protein [Trueperaceae bacterium]|nr:MoaD/ThiS family protein [Trueperaceae bacterium]
MTSEKTVRVAYYALLREARGEASERVVTAARDAAGLYEELRALHSLPLPRSALRVAINDEFAAWERELADGDQVAFIPPVAGG